jgi:hypothetical protein
LRRKIADGVFPFKSNMTFGRYLDPESDDPCSSFLQRPANPPSKVYDRLVVGLGVPEAVLYSLCTKRAEESDEGIWDADARAFGRAFKDSLDTIKHHVDVELPSHLREKIKPSYLQKCIRWV